MLPVFTEATGRNLFRKKLTKLCPWTQFLILFFVTTWLNKCANLINKRRQLEQKVPVNRCL